MIAVHFVGHGGAILLKPGLFEKGQHPRIGESIVQLGTKKRWQVKRIQYMFREDGTFANEVLVILAPKRRPTAKDYT